MAFSYELPNCIFCKEVVVEPIVKIWLLKEPWPPSPENVKLAHPECFNEHCFVFDREADKISNLDPNTLSCKHCNAKFKTYIQFRQQKKPRSSDSDYFRRYCIGCYEHLSGRKVDLVDGSL